MNSYSDTESDADSNSECIEMLDKWIITIRDEIYNKNIKSPNNSEDSISEYIAELETYGNTLNHAIKKEHTNILLDNGWPNELMECIKTIRIKNEIIDRIEYWCIRYPFVKNIPHMNELINE